jgi:hypothetical protein
MAGTDLKRAYYELIALEPSQQQQHAALFMVVLERLVAAAERAEEAHSIAVSDEIDDAVTEATAPGAVQPKLPPQSPDAYVFYSSN